MIWMKNSMSHRMMGLIAKEARSILQAIMNKARMKGLVRKKKTNNK